MGLYDRDWYREEARNKRQLESGSGNPGNRRNRIRRGGKSSSWTTYLLGMVMMTAAGGLAYALYAKSPISRMYQVQARENQTSSQAYQYALVYPAQAQHSPINPRHTPARAPEPPRVMIMNDYRPTQQSQAEVNRADNQRRLAEIAAKERNCRYWRSYGIDYPLEVIHENVNRYCR